MGLPHDQQRQELAAWLGAREARRRVYQRAAQAINDYLGELEGKPVLPEVAQRIQAALTR
jgi:hypothetical protein